MTANLDGETSLKTRHSTSLTKVRTIIWNKIYFLGCKLYFLGCKLYFLWSKIYFLGSKIYFLRSKNISCDPKYISRNPKYISCDPGGNGCPPSARAYRVPRVRESEPKARLFSRQAHSLEWKVPIIIFILALGVLCLGNNCSIDFATN